MGNEFCQGCKDNCLSGALEQNFASRNKPEENIIYRNSEYMASKTASCMMYTQNQITENKSEIHINPKLTRVFTDFNDKKKLNDIIVKYYVKILVKYFRKFKFLKQKMLKKIIVEKYSISSNQKEENNSKYNIHNNINNLLDINITPQNNYVFIGHKFNGKKEGYGLEIYSEINGRYFGQFKNGKKTGFCRYSTYNSEQSFCYIGETLNNKICGYGHYENSKDGKKYEGEWNNSMRNGYGVEIYQEGSLYEGTFLNGKKHGIGKYIWMDKSFYEGEWSNNYLNGYGKYNYSDGSVYLGSWYYNKMEGFGEYVHPTKRTYLGFFKNNAKSGFGILFKITEKKAFIGFWERNKQNGLGQFIHEKKVIYGVWKDGKLTSKIEEKKDFFQKLSYNERLYINNFKAKDFTEFNQRITKFLFIE